MNNPINEPKWYRKENWEKLLLIFLCLMGYVEFAGLTIYAFLKNSDITETVIYLFFALIVFAITGLLLRKGMKYSISSKLFSVGVGYDSITTTKTEDTPVTTEENLKGEG